MKKLIWIWMLLLPLFTVGTGCSSDAETEFPDLVDLSGVVNYSRLDYSLVGGHPRLLMNAEDFETIKGKIEQNTSSDLQLAHNRALEWANWSLSQPTLERVLEGMRLLNISRQAMMRIFNCAYAYRITGNAAYLSQAEKDLVAVCSFRPDWNPSHWLDVAEMSVAVAIGYDWLYDALSASTREQCEFALERFCFDSSDQNVDKLSRTTNWNSVCNAGVVLAAIAMYDKMPARCEKLINRSLVANQNVLDVYGPDGAYPEGYGYWDYGTSFNVLMFQALNKTFGTDCDLSDTPGFLKSAEYMMYMEGPSGANFNYSDGNEFIVGSCGMWWCARKSGDPSILYNELAYFRKTGGYREGGYGNQHNRLYPMLIPLIADLDVQSVRAPQKKVWVGKGEKPVVLVHTTWTNGEDDQFLGIVGGCATTSHAHMDAGNFVYESQGVRWAVDLGSDNYTNIEANMSDLWKYTQTSKRWTLLRLKNTFHNTVTLDDEPFDVGGVANISHVYDSDAGRGALLSMRGPLGASVTDAERSLKIVGDHLEIEDNLTPAANKTLRWRMVTRAVPAALSDNCWQLEQNGKTVYLTVEATVPFTLKSWPAVPEHDYESQNPGVSVVGFESSVKAGEQVVCKVTIAPTRP